MTTLERSHRLQITGAPSLSCVAPALQRLASIHHESESRSGEYGKGANVLAER